MTTSQPKLSREEDKRIAWQRRHNDTGWGRVLLQSWVPFYWIHYAISRRTITPWLHGNGFAIAAALLVSALLGATEADAQKVKQQTEPLTTLVSLFVAPLGYKLGTDSARQFGKQKLEEE